MRVCLVYAISFLPIFAAITNLTRYFFLQIAGVSRVLQLLKIPKCVQPTRICAFEVFLTQRWPKGLVWSGSVQWLVIRFQWTRLLYPYQIVFWSVCMWEQFPCIGCVWSKLLQREKRVFDWPSFWFSCEAAAASDSRFICACLSSARGGVCCQQSFCAWAAGRLVAMTAGAANTHTHRKWEARLGIFFFLLLFSLVCISKLIVYLCSVLKFPPKNSPIPKMHFLCFVLVVTVWLSQRDST